MHEGQFNTVISSDGMLMPVSWNAEKWYWWDVFKQPSHPEHTQAWGLCPIMNISSQHITQTFVPSGDIKQSTFTKKAPGDSTLRAHPNFYLAHAHTHIPVQTRPSLYRLPWAAYLFTQWSHVGLQITVTQEQGNFLCPCLPQSHRPWLQIKAVWVHSKHKQPETRAQTLWEREWSFRDRRSWWQHKSHTKNHISNRGPQRWKVAKHKHFVTD